ncbi:MAG: sugar phosphate isomerase/epimerase family protein [Candidatus Spyradocola sp.]|nr:sugar phosphate isomerase/epimerase family protein [Candidatus Spyradocola sp.]
MAKFTLTGFADEIDPALSVQMDVLDRLDIHYIETRGIDGKNISEYTPAEAKTIHARLKDRGFAVSALGSPIGKIGVNDPFVPHLDNFRRLIDVAHELDTRYIRMFSFYTPQGEDPDACRDEVMQRLSALVEANRGSGVTLLHENEKAIYGDTPERCLDILQTFDGKILCTYDPSNFVQCGVDNEAAFRMLAPYVRYLHVKDSVYVHNSERVDHGFENVSDAHRPAGQGDGKVAWILSQLAQSGYEGFASIEPHLSNNPNVPGTGADKFAAAAAALRGLLAKL